MSRTPQSCSGVPRSPLMVKGRLQPVFKKFGLFRAPPDNGLPEGFINGVNLPKPTGRLGPEARGAYGLNFLRHTDSRSESRVSVKKMFAHFMSRRYIEAHPEIRGFVLCRDDK